MINMSKEDKKEPGFVLGAEVDESDSFDTINALVAAGMDCTCILCRVSC